MLKKKFKTESASPFLVGTSSYLYRFPFVALDPTPGGKNLGRIEWSIELLHGRKKRGVYIIEKLLVWALQTRDERYFGKVFEIPAYAELLQGFSISEERSAFTSLGLRCVFCELHGALAMTAYPKSEHSALVINATSSISLTIEFE